MEMRLEYRPNPTTGWRVMTSVAVTSDTDTEPAGSALARFLASNLHASSLSAGEEFRVTVQR